MIFIQASNIHQGGGAVLLDDLISGLIRSQQNAVIYVDSRFKSKIENLNHIRIITVKPTILGRLRIEWQLRQDAVKNPEANFLFFGNLPPLFKSNRFAKLFFQNVIMLNGSKSFKFGLKSKIKQGIEKLWLRQRISSIHQVYVQSESVRQLFLLDFPSASIEVVPFSTDFVKTEQSKVLKNSSPQFDFLYVASADPHKNHLRLLQAWLLLAQQGLTPSLVLTSNYFPDATKEVFDQIKLAGGHVLTMPNLSHAQVMQLYLDSRAVIYPSLAESFGLPLLEAHKSGIEILASELDYVRDLIDPIQSFDPNSHVSIARAVQRYLKTRQAFRAEIFDSVGFLNCVSNRE